ncbi:hypothetical protein [Paraburkholderia sp. MM5477-R1]|uniref:hypothetical protein n=1 Tax=Paraburkholderia sp. MM5477-R1 TaxID=2991062 RepID=UPI003D224F65
MATIDIVLPDELTQALTPPECIDLSLPTLSAMPNVTLPMGETIQGMADFTRGIPTDCSMNFSLMLQLAPLMGSMECLLRVLKFIGVVVNILKNLTSPTQLLTAVSQITKAAEDLLQCLNIAIPGLPICTFVKDLLLLISTMLLCVVQELESLLKILGGLQLQISIAEASGNRDLLAALQCAQQNATTSAEGAMQSLQPVMVLLSLASPFMEIGNINLDVTIPSAVPASDLQAMQTLLDDLGTAATVIKQVAQALPC